MKNFGLDFILKLKPCSWNWKKSFGEDKRTHFGMIAQDVDELASVKDFGFVQMKEEYYALNYWEFVGPIIASIQELHKNTGEEILELRQRIEELEKQLEK